MRTKMHVNVLDLDCAAEAERIGTALKDQLAHDLHRRGVVVGVSGGIDSAVCLALAVRALGPRRVFGLLLPERDSPRRGIEYGQLLCEQQGVRYGLHDLTRVLTALGAYAARDAAVRAVYPAYTAACRMKLVIGDAALADDHVAYFKVVIQTPAGEQITRRLPHDAYLQIVAATNMKQRSRKLMEYYHAERLNYAVLGTPNRLEHDLGFFVRGGDGLADVKPIAHLYKTQVYALAAYLDIPTAILQQAPSTDTYSLAQSQEEFYFALPYQQMDLLLYAHHHGVPAADVAGVLKLTTEQVRRAYRDIVGKLRMGDRLRRAAITCPRSSNASPVAATEHGLSDRVTHGV